MYRLDRTAFHKGKAETESLRQAQYWHKKTPQERLQATYYLICQIYGYKDGVMP